ncbi:MAG: NAD(P)/FAD-dependent oxidoreductase [Bacillota bacterium]
MYDIAIVGGGPAGLAAAVNARRRNKTVVAIAKEEISSKMIQAHLIENYLGLPQISGRELIQKMKDHSVNLGTVFIKDEIQNIYPDGAKFQLIGRENAIEASAVVLAVGVSLASEIEGEQELVGRGVSYCATCDGMFFKGKTVAMIGYIPEAEHEAAFLAEICAKVYYLPQYKLETLPDPRITLVHGKPRAIKGNEHVELLKTTVDELEVTGVFIERSGRPAEQLLDGLRIENGFILADNNQATNIPGVFAAGDCTGKPWQISRAAGQGQVAALNAVHYLEKINS